MFQLVNPKKKTTNKLSLNSFVVGIENLLFKLVMQLYCILREKRQNKKIKKMNAVSCS